ncbi:tetratricopeptide repeat protein [Flavobacterium humi]|uniref:tetratricopeptide repeat protein n=1 Tax=Flavobacterium humi TaxID=2562683 RepID=UPI00146A67FF|nr:tetratricopeptide repeat protein [Flavobacterium humi]
MDGLNIIESGIDMFGSVPELIKGRYQLSLELYQNGIGKKNIDGNSIYLSQNEKLKFDDTQFKEENLKSALADLEYLTHKFPDSNEELFIIAKIHQLKGAFEKSNQAFEKLSALDEFNDEATFNIATNYVQLKKYDEAEKYLMKLLSKYPKEPQILNKLSELYELSGNKIKQDEFNKKAIFNNHVPYFSNIEYNDKNFEVVTFFSSEQNDAKAKLSKLDKIQKSESEDYTIDICLTILKIHTNHGNGVEEKATEILAKIGKPALEKTHKLFNTDVSTCTITNLSEIMSKVKDESSWQILVEYLPKIAHMPMTMMPPNVPEEIIRFNEEKGAKEVLKVVKKLLNKENTDSEDPMAQLAGFSDYIYYSPLKKISKQKLKKYTAELNFTEEEIKKLNEKLN